MKKAFANFKHHHETFEKEFNRFCKENTVWLDDFALFMAAKEAHGGIVWKDWDEGLVLREKKSLDEWKKNFQTIFFIRNLFSLYSLNNGRQ